VLRLSVILLFCTHIVSGQSSKVHYNKSVLQLGLFPGLSTNGVHPGEYNNLFSVNVFTGYGHSTKYFEVNGLAGFNTASSSGIHISGLASFIGGNGLAGLTEKQKRREHRRGYETNLSGFQFSGMMNYVATNTFGAQVTLGVNTNVNYLIGSQFSGLFNYVGGFTIGTQVSVIGNFTKKSMTGVQLAVLLNSTQRGYSGIQIGAYNHAGVIGTLKMPSSGYGTAWQIGLINTSGNMGGWQIGLVNIGKRVVGTQIGIINIFKSGKSVDYKDGPAFALLNFGYYINPRVYVSELFISNYGLYTGKPLNSRVMSASRYVYSYNEVVYSTNYKLENDINWGVSYRAGLISFYKAPDPTSQKNYFSLMAEIGHIDWDTQVKKQLNLRYAVHLEAGFRLSKKMSFVYPFASVSYNYLPKVEGDSPELLAQAAGTGKLWLGYAVGIMLH
jgi:hypothetical protein